MICQSSITMIQQIFDRIRTLCKECNLALLPPKLAVSDLFGFICYGTPILPLQNYFKAFEELRSKIFEYGEVKDEYRKLEEALQRNETEIRKHIGVDQQLRLYIDTIKAQFQESENERLELVENSKRMIKQLKKENEKLHQKATGYDLKQKNNSSRIKMIRNNTRERVRTDHSSSLNINNLHKFHTENPYISPIKTKGSDFKTQLTERYETSKKKKFGESKKKINQSNTLMAYAGQQKKRRSKDKTNTKKGLANFSNVKEDYDEIEIHQRTNSDKKVNRVQRSYFSLSSFNNKDSKKTSSPPKGKYQRETTEEKFDRFCGNNLVEQ